MQQNGGLGSGWPTSAALATAIAHGDAGAESALVEKYGPGLMYVLRREVFDRHVAEDIYQECFRIVLERLRERGLEEPDKLAAFLLGVARRLVKAHRRAASRFVEEGSAAVECTEDHGPTPCEQVIRWEETRTLLAAIKRLAVPRDRELLARRYIMGQDKEAICQTLGLDSRQFNRAIYRARERLKREIDTAGLWLKPAS